MEKTVILLMVSLPFIQMAVQMNKIKFSKDNVLPGENDWESWSKEELEKQMGPSQWNQRNLSSDEVLKDYIKVGTDGTNEARKSLKHELDVPYGPLPLEKFDVYGTDLNATAPTCFWIHGGYWQFRGKELAGQFAINAHRWGLRTIVMGYTIAPEGKIEQMEQEVVEALKVAMAKYPQSNFIVGGHSAGGQLAASLLMGNASSSVPQLLKQVKGLLLVSGVYDLRPLVNTSTNDKLTLTLESAKALSALFNTVQPAWKSIVGMKNCIFVGNFDSPEFKRQTQGFVEQLKGVLDVHYWISLDDDHFTLVQNFGNETTEAGKQLKEYLQQFTQHEELKNSSSSTNLLGTCSFLLLMVAFVILSL